MKTLISLFTLLLTAQLSFAQSFDDSLKMDQKNQVSIVVDGFQTNVTVNNNIRNNRLVLGGIEEMKEYKKRKLNFQFESMDTLVLQNGNIQKIYQFKVAEIAFGNVLLRNFPVEFEYVIATKGGRSKLVSSHPTEVGLGYLRLFSNAQINGNILKLEDIQCEYSMNPVACNPTNNGNPVGNPLASQPAVVPPTTTATPVSATNQNVTVRIVPCSLTTDVTQIKSQVRMLLAAANVTIEEETNVPPPAKALNRVSDGVTLRYFANDDEALAKNYLGQLQQQLTGFTISEENMVPYFKNPIPSYFEIWIK